MSYGSGHGAQSFGESEDPHGGDGDKEEREDAEDKDPEDSDPLSESSASEECSVSVPALDRSHRLRKRSLSAVRAKVFFSILVVHSLVACVEVGGRDKRWDFTEQVQRRLTFTEQV